MSEVVRFVLGLGLSVVSFVFLIMVVLTIIGGVLGMGYFAIQGIHRFGPSDSSAPRYVLCDVSEWGFIEVKRFHTVEEARKEATYRWKKESTLKREYSRSEPTDFQIVEYDGPTNRFITIYRSPMDKDGEKLQPGILSVTPRWRYRIHWAFLIFCGLEIFVIQPITNPWSSNIDILRYGIVLLAGWITVKFVDRFDNTVSFLLWAVGVGLLIAVAHSP